MAAGSGNKGAATILMKFFGRKDGESLADFAKEVRTLTDEDVPQLVGGISDGSLNY